MNFTSDWIGLEQSIIDTAVNKRRNHLCACGLDTLFFTVGS